MTCEFSYGAAEAVPFKELEVRRLETRNWKLNYGEPQKTTFEGADVHAARARFPDVALAFRVPELSRTKIASPRLPEVRLL